MHCIQSASLVSRSSGVALTKITLDYCTQVTCKRHKKLALVPFKLLNWYVRAVMPHGHRMQTFATNTMAVQMCRTELVKTLAKPWLMCTKRQMSTWNSTIMPAFLWYPRSQQLKALGERSENRRRSELHGSWSIILLPENLSKRINGRDCWVIIFPGLEDQPPQTNMTSRTNRILHVKRSLHVWIPDNIWAKQSF